jgi:peptidoglycan/xylan/chitin deacetylase (PgdA/CDA1 family)
MIAAYILIVIVLVGLLVFVTVEYCPLLPSAKGLLVLMYHRVSPDEPDALTVTTAQFGKQLEYLRLKGYKTISFRELANLHNKRTSLPDKTLIITFDDGYEDFRSLALPLLKEYGFGATVFIPVGYMGKTNVWDHGNIPLMNAEEIKKLSEEKTIEFGLHSYLHGNYNKLSATEIANDLDLCEKKLSDHGITYSRVLAYPYGAYPKRDLQRQKELFGLFREKGLMFAVRIGNRINRYPIRSPYQICRIDIRGNESFRIFRIKIKKGRARLFT